MTRALYQQSKNTKMTSMINPAMAISVCLITNNEYSIYPTQPSSRLTKNIFQNIEEVIHAHNTKST